MTDLVGEDYFLAADLDAVPVVLLAVGGLF